MLKLVQLPAPSPNIATSSAWHALLKRLLSVSIRVQGKGMAKTWTVEFVFYGSPLSSSHTKEQGIKLASSSFSFLSFPIKKIIKCKFLLTGLRRPVYFQYDMGTADTVTRTVDALLNDWAQIVHLYSIVHDLAEYFKIGMLQFHGIQFPNCVHIECQK